ncbi:cocosin 1 isoform X2 [Elaeis guineensis]|uniref:Cocosin 1 isoform X2 n=1 Tax=Elaeis guineensis var. tenera TaxID=51953 RepID=A0A6I9S9Y9_ELAGV|nr:cocosin 1 isoform X2 [Elaeis guineensis]
MVRLLMATSTASLLSFFLCLLLLCHSSLSQRECRLDRLNTLQPTRRVESEAGVTEYFDEKDDQLQCAGVSVRRRTIEPNGLLLPSYSSSPRLIYILQGRGISASIMPGCPTTFQSVRRSEQEGEEGSQRQRFRDDHQKIHRFRAGDVLAIPAGIANWCYNDGDTPVVTLTVFDTRSNANQLDQNQREFQLAGSQRGSQQVNTGKNVLRGFRADSLAAALGVDRELARKLQLEDDRRGEIVRVERSLQVLRPPSEEEEKEMSSPNGLEETYCSMRIKENIETPSAADVYTRRGGRITTLNSHKLPILRFIQMSATRVVLYRKTILAPHWNINAHSVSYCTGGRGRVQVVDDEGKAVFDGELRRGQLLVIPKNFAVIKQAREEGFELISIKTNSAAMVNTVVGKASAIKGLPEDVLMHSYNISRDEARRVKYRRGDEMALFTPSEA